MAASRWLGLGALRAWNSWSKRAKTRRHAREPLQAGLSRLVPPEVGVCLVGAVAEVVQGEDVAPLRGGRPPGRLGVLAAGLDAGGELLGIARRPLEERARKGDRPSERSCDDDETVTILRSGRESHGFPRAAMPVRAHP